LGISPTISTPGWHPSLLLVLTPNEVLGIPPKAITSSIVSRTDIFADEHSIRDKENVDFAVFGEVQENTRVLPSALGDEAIPTES
jgi:hypothetical protein